MNSQKKITKILFLCMFTFFTANACEITCEECCKDTWYIIKQSIINCFIGPCFACCDTMPICCKNSEGDPCCPVGLEHPLLVLSLEKEKRRREREEKKVSPLKSKTGSPKPQEITEVSPLE